MKTGVFLLLATALALGACAEDTDPEPAPTPDAVAEERDVCEELQFGNAADAAMCPRVQRAGLNPRYADATTVCRRMAIDLLGRTPTWTEVEGQCQGKSPAEMVDYFMSQPEYVRRHQRRWADLFQYNDGFSHYRHILALDELVAQLYRGEVNYARFGELALTHPGYTGRHFGEARVAVAFRVFLGRDAHPVERADMVGLWTIWQPVQDYDADYYFQHIDVRAYPPICQPPLDELLCHSSVYGDTTVAIPLRDPDASSYRNLIRPDDLTEDEWEALRAPGRILAALPYYNEHAVTEAMDRYLGWGAAAGLPEVRLALLRYFEGVDLDVPAMERELLTSHLYLQTTTPPENEVAPLTGEAPRWRYSPVKFMDVETWLDSLSLTVKRDFGQCDHRFPYVRNGVHPQSGQTIYAPHAYPVANPETNTPDFTYATVARVLGGCPDRLQQFRFTGTGVVHALDQESILQYLCYLPDATGLLPGGHFNAPFAPGADRETRTALFRHQIRSFYSREPADAELGDFLDSTDACLASSACTPDQLPAQLCVALTQGAEFLHY